MPTIKQQLSEKGFNEKNDKEDDVPRGHPVRVKKYISLILAGEKQVEVESKLVNYALGSTVILILLISIAYISIFNSVNNIQGYIPLLLLTIIGSVMTVVSSYHMSCYRKGLSCTNGMMIGMTMGMISGFMVGALLGATNGIFIGSIAGMVVGIGLGANLGRHCGTMGAMEGTMAGLMAGTMGAMLSVMMVNDNLIIFLYLLFAVCIFVLGGLSYMMYRESGAAPKEDFNLNFKNFVLACVFFAILIIAIMIYGPKNGLVYTG